MVTSPQQNPPPRHKVRAGALLLAAGFSRRFRGSKLLAPLPHVAATVFEQTLSRLSQSAEEIIIVCRPEMAAEFTASIDKTLSRHVSPPAAPIVRLVEFDAAHLGMGASLSFAAQQIDGWEVCLVCLADMPYVCAQTYALLAERCSSASLVTPYFEGKRGQPTAFGASYFDELRQLQGDTGARELLKKHAAQTLALDIDDGGILRDIDTRDDLEPGT